jgi:hypothetical protein
MNCSEVLGMDNLDQNALTARLGREEMLPVSLEDLVVRRSGA